MSVLRRATVMPTSQCSTSPRWITGSAPSSASVVPRRCTSTLGWNQVSRPRSLTRCRHHHTRSLVFVTPGVIVFSENISCVIDQTSSVIFAKKTSSSGRRTAMSSRGSASASLKREVQVLPSALDIPSSSPLERPSENANTVDLLMPMTFGFRSSTTPLRACHWSSPQSSACCPRPTSPAAATVARRASKTPPCEVPPRAIRSMQLAAAGCPAAAHRSKNT